MAYIHVEPDEFSDRELINELESRGYRVKKDGECDLEADGISPWYAQKLYDRIATHDPRAQHEVLEAIAEAAGRIL